MKTQNEDFFLAIKIAFLFLGFLLIVISIFERLGIHLPSFKISKQQIARYYQVNKRTLTNWLNCFMEESLLEQVNNRRKIPLDIAYQIYQQLGNPEEFPVLNRKAIIELGEGKYNQLAITINRVAEDYNLPIEKLTKMRTFPPVYGKIIADNFGLHTTDIEKYLHKQ